MSDGITVSTLGFIVGADVGLLKGLLELVGKIDGASQGDILGVDDGIAVQDEI